MNQRRFNPAEYETVDERIRAFHDHHPTGCITTDIIELGDKRVVVKAHVSRDGGRIDATGHAMEVFGSSSVNQTSALENCETSAVGRALRNLAVTSRGGPSREEMSKAHRPAPTVADLVDMIAAAGTMAELERIREIIRGSDLPVTEKLQLRAEWDSRAGDLG